jgi:hypothetical protein
MDYKYLLQHNFLWGHSGVTLNCFRLANDLAFPSGVFGPVLIPPWFLHLPLASACALQGFPVDRAYAPHRALSLLRLRGAGLRLTRCCQSSLLASSCSIMFIPKSKLRTCARLVGVSRIFSHKFSHKQLVQTLYLDIWINP